MHLLQAEDISHTSPPRSSYSRRQTPQSGVGSSALTADAVAVVLVPRQVARRFFASSAVCHRRRSCPSAFRRYTFTRRPHIGHVLTFLRGTSSRLILRPPVGPGGSVTGVRPSKRACGLTDLQHPSPPPSRRMDEKTAPRAEGRSSHLADPWASAPMTPRSHTGVGARGEEEGRRYSWGCGHDGSCSHPPGRESLPAGIRPERPWSTSPRVGHSPNPNRRRRRSGRAVRADERRTMESKVSCARMIVRPRSWCT